MDDWEYFLGLEEDLSEDSQAAKWGERWMGEIEKRGKEREGERERHVKMKMVNIT